MKSNHEIIWEHQRAIVQIYEQHSLDSLRGIKSDYMVNGRQILAWHSDVVRKGKIKHGRQFNFNQNFDDIIFCSDEIMYFIAQMYLYLPYINNPLNEGFLHYGEMVYPNFQNIEAKRYNMYAGIVSEKIYNYWDRLGDLIAAYFPDVIDKSRVYFSTAVKGIPDKYHREKSFLWLKDFLESDYKALNTKRIHQVHYLTEDTSFKHKHLDAATNEEMLKEHIKYRDGLADYYKEHIRLTFSGFENVMNLLELITAEALSDVE